MKTAEQALTEWASDSIKFMNRRYTRRDFGFECNKIMNGWAKWFKRRVQSELKKSKTTLPEDLIPDLDGWVRRFMESRNLMRLEFKKEAGHRLWSKTNDMVKAIRDGKSVASVPVEIAK